jgi:CheY-like chemotaxis protein
VELPIRREAGAAEEPEGATVRPWPGAVRPLNVLAVDDEPVILDLLVDVLTGARHRVDTAACGQEALRKLERGGYDLVLLDVRMPDVDGQKIFETICERWPALRDRVVFTSGDTAHAGTRAFIDRSGRPCIEKPFRLESLAAILAESAAPGGEPLRRTGTESP